MAEQFLKDHPGSPFTSRILLTLGNAQKEKGQLKESIATYARIANAFPLRPEADEATAQLGIQLTHMGKGDTASVVFSSYLRTYPKGFFSADVLYEIGMLSAREDKPLIAATSFELLRTKYFYSPRAVECVEALAESYQKTNQFDKAVALYRKQLDRLSSPLQSDAKGRPEIVFQLGRTYDAAHDTADARREYLELVSEDAHSSEASEAFARLAVFEKQSGRSDASIQFFEKSIAAKRTAANTAELASLYFANSDYQKAISGYESVAGLKDADSSMIRSSRKNVIVALFRSEKAKDADRMIAEFLKSYGADKNSLAEFEFERAMTFYRGEEPDRALAILKAFPAKYDSTQILPQACFWVGKSSRPRNSPTAP